MVHPVLHVHTGALTPGTASVDDQAFSRGGAEFGVVQPVLHVHIGALTHGTASVDAEAFSRGGAELGVVHPVLSVSHMAPRQWMTRRSAEVV